MPFFENLFPNISSKQIIGLNEAALAVYLNQYLKTNEKNIVVVLSSLFEANQLFQYVQSYTDQVYLFPMDDFLTSEALAISPELKYTRLSTLERSFENTPCIIITNLMGYLRYLPNKEEYQKHILTIEKNKDYPMANLIEMLYELGYHRETIVTRTGEMAIRGFVVDLFPVGYEYPIRLEFWGDTIDSIRSFDVETQLTKQELTEVIIKPDTEFIVSTSVSEEEMKQKYLPKYGSVTNINNYYNGQIMYIGYHQLKISYELLQNEILNYNYSLDLPGDTKYMNNLEDIEENSPIYFEPFDNIISNIEAETYNTYDLELFPKSLEDINKLLNKYIQEQKTVIICFKDRYQMNKLLDHISNPSFIITNEDEIFKNKVNLIIHSIERGFSYQNYIIVGERELFSKKETRIAYKSNFKYGSKIKDITKLNIGDYIVHNTCGIGRYIGLKTLEKNRLKKDYLMIEYKDGDHLYVPIEKIDFITKYSSNDGAIPKLNKLGTNEWEKTKLRVRKKIESIAGELLKLYAEREASVGYSFIQDDENQIQFEQCFPYEDTVDQRKVTEEIKRDMESTHPMDRLLCGDVGYGKTEVAFRAIMKCILSGKQAAMLCPTTILSNQHYQNAIERFQDFPINISLLNRFITTKQVNEIKKQLEQGKIDFIIGTHRLLSEDIKFKDLGLLVIDEEQRFGVKHKEKIKELKTNIDVLTLSATPIPRTLQMSMTGVRSLSLIETPPVNRYPIQTYVLAENKNIIKDAIYKELSRQGQIFILFNRIDEMESKMREISRLVPDARIISAHGRMNKNELEDVMIKFTEKEYDVLLCTTIIETGIDIPNVNTLIIIDADYFGLSQLYQIRGRVGRGNKIAYCYLMYHPGKSLSDIATKRLEVIKEFTELGSGFSIAMRDLSIRGAGDILGKEQAGFVDSVGIELYLNMLNEEVDRLKGKPIKEEQTTDKPLIEVTTSINNQYVEDTDLKIEIHKKINQIDSYEKLEEVKHELEDRFGTLNEDMIIYMHEEWFEKLAQQLKITRVRQTANFIELTLPKELTNQINGEQLFMEANKLTRNIRFAMRLETLIITLDIVRIDKHFVYYLIDLMKIIKNSQKNVDLM